MSRPLTATDHAAMPAVLAAVLASPGIRQIDIAAQLGIPSYRATICLTELRRQGRVGLVRYGQSQAPRWYTPAEAMKIRARFEREAADKRRERNRQYAATVRRQDQLRGDGVADAPVQRVTSCWGALPFVCRAPRSVFDLGSMA